MKPPLFPFNKTSFTNNNSSPSTLYTATVYSTAVRPSRVYTSAVRPSFTNNNSSPSTLYTTVYKVGKERVSRRGFVTECNKLTKESAKDALNQILAISQQKQFADLFKEVRNAECGVIMKWQYLVAQINKIIEHIASIYDFPDASKFQLALFDAMAEDKTGEVAQLYARNWDSWLFLVFDFVADDHPFKFDVVRTRLLISDLLDAFSSSEYLIQINQIFHEDLPEEEKAKKFFGVMEPLHMKVIEEYGFEGDIGFLQSQRIINCAYPADEHIRKLCDTTSRLGIHI